MAGILDKADLNITLLLHLKLPKIEPAIERPFTYHSLRQIVKQSLAKLLFFQVIFLGNRILQKFDNQEVRELAVSFIAWQLPEIIAQSLKSTILAQ
jgi:hypothetical protein